MLLPSSRRRAGATAPARRRQPPPPRVTRTARIGGRHRPSRRGRSPRPRRPASRRQARPGHCGQFGFTGTHSKPAATSDRKTSNDGRPGFDDAPTTAIRRVVRRTRSMPSSSRIGTAPRPSWRSRKRSRSITFLACQVAASRSYGWPSAAGGMLRPTTPARMMIVTRYGTASKNCGGTDNRISPS